VIEVGYYKEENGRSPFLEWMSSLRDERAKSKPVGEGVMELRVHVGAGYRAYCGRHGQHWIILLCGGDKDTQPKDIARAKVLWAEWKKRQS
jgi:putative component of toxin-antitoxin plasmid stabilization module